jgi:hypothetical protein
MAPLTPADWSRIATVISVSIYVACLPLPGFSCVKQQSAECGMDGLDAMLFGAIGGLLVLGYPSMAAWWANPALLIAWIALFFGARRYAVLCSAVSLVLGLSFLLFHLLPIFRILPGGGMAPDGEVTGVGLGYWLWLTSIAVSLLSALWGIHQRALG